MKHFVAIVLLSLAAAHCVKRRAPAADKNGAQVVQAVLSIAEADATKITFVKSDTGRKDVPADAILARKQVPVLTYHNINNKHTKSEYTVSEERFDAQLKMLADSGYHTILPEELYRHLTTGAALPSKPVMLTFDDTHIEHYTVAAAVMRKYNFKGVFFIMTIAIGKPGYMTKDQIKALADEGHAIGGHTWDHHSVTVLRGNDWQRQLDKPKQQLESLTGKPVTSFAYPYGSWNETAITELKKRAFNMAFQLTGKQSNANPLFTIRRIIVPGSWPPAHLYRWMQFAFL